MLERERENRQDEVHPFVFGTFVSELGLTESSSKLKCVKIRLFILSEREENCSSF